MNSYFLKRYFAAFRLALLFVLVQHINAAVVTIPPPPPVAPIILNPISPIVLNPPPGNTTPVFVNQYIPTAPIITVPTPQQIPITPTIQLPPIVLPPITTTSSIMTPTMPISALPPPPVPAPVIDLSSMVTGIKPPAPPAPPATEFSKIPQPVNIIYGKRTPPPPLQYATKSLPQKNTPMPQQCASE